MGEAKCVQLGVKDDEVVVKLEDQIFRDSAYVIATL